MTDLLTSLNDWLIVEPDRGYAYGLAYRLTSTIFIVIGIFIALKLAKFGYWVLRPALRVIFWPFAFVTEKMLRRGAPKSQRVQGAQTRMEWNKIRPHVAPAVLDRDGWTCQAPGCEMPLTEGTWTIDHVIPISKGGSNKYSNLRAMCRPCNSSKGAMMPATRRAA